MATAFLVIDCQVFFAAELKKPMPNILSLIRDFSTSKATTYTVFTQHGHTADELSGKIPNQIVKRWGPANSIAINSPEWGFVPEIAEAKARAKDVHVTPKNSYDSFVNTGLETWLRERKVERVIVAGCLTDFCCETTAKSAFCRGFETWFVEDACGTASSQQHKEGVNGFEKLCGAATRTAKVLDWLERRE